MSRKLTEKEFFEKAKEVHGDKYDYSKTKFVNTRGTVLITCKIHGDFEQRANSHLQGNGCKHCAKIWSDSHKLNHTKSSRDSRGLGQDEFIKRCMAVHNGKYDYSLVNYVNRRTKVDIICKIHGVFSQVAGSHLQGIGCKLCGSHSEKHKGAHFWSYEQREKIKKTCLERYGTERYLDSKEGREKFHKIRQTEDFRKRMSIRNSSDEVQAKTRKTNLNRYGVVSPMKLKEITDKVYISKKKNHTVDSSNTERIVFRYLCDIFGDKKVVHHYKDKERYPYACDFYLIDLDVFIELNLHWSHGRHFFGSCDDDYKILKDWQLRADESEYYSGCIKTWTERDLEKRDTAIKNNLNYLVFWKNDLSDFMEWLEAYKNGNIILKNI